MDTGVDNVAYSDFEILIDEKKFKIIHELFSSLQDEDIAEILENISESHAAVTFRLIPKDRAIVVFENLDPDRQLDILNELSDVHISELIEDMDSDERIELFEEAPAGIVNKLFSMLSAEERKITYKILGYPEDSVGRSINTKFLALEMNTSAKEAIDLIREKGKDLETVFYIYVLDKERKMVGVASLKDIVISDSSRTLHEIADTNVIMVNPYMDQEEVIEIFEKYDLLALPVVDRENRVIGIITFDDLTDIIEEEKEEDFEVMAAMAPSDESYMDASVWRLIKKRVVWLLIFLLIETISGLVMQHYDLLLRQFIILSYFIPMLLNAGGTAGSQTSTLIIRGMAMGEIHFSDTWKIIVKETLSALIISLILSSVVVLRFLLLNTGGPYLFKFILVVSLTLVFVIWLAGMIAAIFPIVWKKMGWDPAVISGPLVTTSIDVLGLLVYFAIATTILGVK